MAGLWRIAIRDLRRNKRRSAATLLAMLLGVGMLVVLAGFMEGMFIQSLQDNIRVQTSHLQLRDADYDRKKASLKWPDLVEDSEEQAARIRSYPMVQDATPLLWTSAVVGLREESFNVSLTGMDFRSDVNAPFRDGVVAGSLPAPDDREGILLGELLAENMDVEVGDSLNLLIPTSGDQPDQANFIIRGLYRSGIPGYDKNTILMPLKKAQSITRTDGRASAILTMLEAREQSEVLEAELEAPGYDIQTWQEMNSFMLEYKSISNEIIYIFYVFILAIVAVVIVNTLLMTVLERTREMGILAALGMKASQIRWMFLIESGVLAAVGIIFGVLIGSLVVEYLSVHGMNFGDTASVINSTEFAVGEVMYAAHSFGQYLVIALVALVVTLLGSLYPAWVATQKEPIEALRAL